MKTNNATGTATAIAPKRLVIKIPKIQAKNNERSDTQKSDPTKFCQTQKKKPESIQVLKQKKEDPNPRCQHTVTQIQTKNEVEMLELFETAKKSADTANAKGILLGKTEASVCVDTLSLLLTFPISATANDTKRILERLQRLTKHKDRKICNAASTLLHHWSQSIRDQLRRDSTTKTIPKNPKTQR